MEKKTVSIVMCTCNGESFIREQLDSIMAQTYPVNEIIIQDDASTDRTYDIVCEYARRYPQIHPRQNETRKGVNGNFFDALSQATGDYIAIADQDDIWEPGKIERQVQTIGDNRVSLFSYVDNVLEKHFADWQGDIERESPGGC